jgi:glycosyltransferase involved in cell wall biosynthesis
MVENIKYSIVVPCYNTERTVLETLESIGEQEYSNWEAIIVNDGSPDNLEPLVLSWIKKDNRFKYYKKENGGLASARNFGIEKSKGSYILPIDSDNKVRPQFLLWADAVLKLNPDVDIIYGDAQRFGEDNSYWEVGKFDKLRLLNGNYIDACAIVKKEVFCSLGCYDENMPHQGFEDWEFWLKCLDKKRNFHYLNKITFDYRISSNSMIRSFSAKMHRVSREYVVRKYAFHYFNAYRNLYDSFKKNKDSSIFFKKIKSFLKKIILKRFFL